MLKRQFLLVFSILLIVLVSLALSSFSVKPSLENQGPAGDFYQRHPGWTVSVQALQTYHLDCFRRNYNFKEPAFQEQDASNYFLNVS